jgi:hypothetical protein
MPATAGGARLGACGARPGHAIIPGMASMPAVPDRDAEGEVGFDDEPTTPSYLTRLAATPEGAHVLARWMAAVESEEDGT